ncbi:MAG: hypothetical protein SVR94_10100 [Pseudomonadota bacterium]|nr:hypothetical protein [Pseudomonadota bacterium]
MTTEEEYINYLVDSADEALQEIQNYCGRSNLASARVRFPRGFIRTATEARRSLPNLGREVQRRNASYALMKNDVFRWLAIRTDLSGTALSMIIKEAISSLGGICEWLTKEAVRGHAGNRPYKQRTKKLVELEIIGEELQIELDWIWDIRCNEHMHEVNTLEHEMYTRTDYNRARKAYCEFRDLLVEIHGQV